MTSTTSIDPDKMRTAADGLEKLFGEPSMTIFIKAQKLVLDAGQFDAAKWLEDLVLDRRKGIYQHALDMRFACEQLAIRLRHIATAFENQDRSGGGGIHGFEKVAAEEINGWVTSVNDFAIPAAKSEQADGGDGYDSHDNSGSDPTLGFGVDPVTGETIVTDDGNVSINIPPAGSIEDLPSDVDELVEDVYTEGNKKDGIASNFTYDGGFFSNTEGQPTIIDPDDPEN